MIRTRYEFWTEWVLETGQLYADVHTTDTVSDARKQHAGALSFAWVRDHHRPSVSDLFAVTSKVDEATGRARLESRVTIADGARHEPAWTLT